MRGRRRGGERHGQPGGLGEVAPAGSRERSGGIHVVGEGFDSWKDCSPWGCGNARKGRWARCDPCPHDKLKYSCADCKAGRDTRIVPAGDATGAAAQHP